MLILTYEAAPTEMLYLYFNHRFAPLKPIQIFGRYAKGEPVCKPSHAVWYAWKDRTSNQNDMVVFQRIELSAFLYSPEVRPRDPVAT